MTKKVLGLRNIMTGGAVVLAAGLGTAGVASAATTHSTSATHLTVKLSKTANDTSVDPTTMPHGPGDSPLTGATLTSAEASATAAVPNATVLSADSDPGGSYVVHLKKSDGTYVTVVENSLFVVTSTHDGFGPGPGDGVGDPSKMTHGPGETVLTGTTLTSAVASAQAAVPSATVVRAETDAQGATYEVHLKKSDGTYVTVKENASFVVTSTQTGFGTRPSGSRDGHDGRFGPPPAGDTGAPNQ